MLSSVVIILELYFRTGVGTVCFSGVNLNTALPMVISCGSGEMDAWEIGVALTVMMDIGEAGCSIGEPLAFSGDLALEMAVIVTGDLIRSGPPLALDFGSIEVGTIVIRGFWRPRVGMIVVLAKKSSARGLVISNVAVLF